MSYKNKSCIYIYMCVWDLRHSLGLDKLHKEEYAWGTKMFPKPNLCETKMMHLIILA